MCVMKKEIWKEEGNNTRLFVVASGACTKEHPRADRCVLTRLECQAQNVASALPGQLPVR